jgi:hypothetical protein
MYENSPIRLVRDRYLMNRVSVAKLPREAILALGVKAWNKFRVRKTLRHLSWKREDGFPIAK